MTLISFGKYWNHGRDYSPVRDPVRIALPENRPPRPNRSNTGGGLMIRRFFDQAVLYHKGRSAAFEAEEFALMQLGYPLITLISIV